MVPLYEACHECAQNCSLLHRNRNASPSITSFFKVMFGGRYSEVLFLPPMFARGIQNMADKETQLKDSRGQKWPVKIRWVDGSLAFQEGWNIFVEDHSLKVGDFLQFDYVAGSHFFVSMYGESGCPETRHFRGNRQQQKNFMKKEKFMPADKRPSNMDASGNCHSFISSSRAGQFVSENEFGVACHKKKKVRRRGEFGADYNRPSTVNKDGHDHSVAPASQSGAIASRNGTGQRPEALATDMGNDSGKVNPSARKMKATVNELARTSDGGNLIEASRAINETKVAKKKAAETSSMNFFNDASRANPIKMTNKEQQARTRDSDIRKETLSGYNPKDINPGSYSSGFARKGHENIQGVKEEPVDLDDTPLLHVDNIVHLAVMENRRYLELPETFYSHIRRGRLDGKVLFLRVGGADDPQLFPVFYENKYGFKILTSYWGAFAREHRFNPGDTCVLQLEDGSGIFRVRVVSKSQVSRLQNGHAHTPFIA